MVHSCNDVVVINSHFKPGQTARPMLIGSAQARKTLLEAPNVLGVHILPCEKQKTIRSTSFLFNR